MNENFINKLYLSHKNHLECASKEAAITFFTNLLGVLLPDFRKEKFSMAEEIDNKLNRLQKDLVVLLCSDATKHAKQEESEKIAIDFFHKLPEVYEKLLKDIKAIFAGDPAAKNTSEVIRAYPGFYAIVAYRIANVLEKMDVGIIPRLITEHAHSLTGIDIHPGATIGQYFCIDHGTGVVIGETALIHDHVKIYQGVTLGALSVDKADANLKRHPTIEENVVIYAGATILGGETTIGANSVIGGNVWITKSVKPNSKIYYKAQMHDASEGTTDMYILKT